jgi:protein-disulfide isomerase
MRMKSLLVATAAALVLAACGGEAGSSGAVKGEPVAKVAAPAGKQWVDVVSKTEEGGYLIGNPDAKIKLVEYASVTCSHCAEFETEAYEPLLTNYVGTGQVSFEVRNFLLNPYDIPISILTRCSGPEAYLALTQQFYQNQRPVLDAMSKVEPATIEAAMKRPETERYVAMAQAMGVIEFFKARGVSEDQAKACLADPSAPKELLGMTEKAASELKVTGTPSFFLNGQLLEISPQPSVWTQVKTRLQEAGAR